MKLGRWLAALVLLVALGATSCSSTSDPAVQQAANNETTDATDSAESVESGTANETEVASQPEPATEESVAAEAFVSPIGEALGVSQDEFAQASVEYEREAQELIRQCMTQAGFDYRIVESGLDQATRRQIELESSRTQDQFTQEYGFGIATLFELNFEGQGVVDFANQQFGPAPTVPRSSGEQAAYEMALNGSTTQGLSPEDAQEQLFGSGIGDATDDSCRGYGYSTAENPGAAYDGLFSILGDEVNALTDRFDSDPRVREAQTEWQTCMATKGHSYEDRFEIRGELFDGANQLANQYLTSSQVLSALGQAQEQGFATMNNDDRAAFLEEVGALQGFSWVPEVRSEYDELVAFELRVAADSSGCSDDELFEEVQFELETEFVEAHSDQLALIAAGDA